MANSFLCRDDDTVLRDLELRDKNLLDLRDKGPLQVDAVDGVVLRLFDGAPDGELAGKEARDVLGLEAKVGDARDLGQEAALAGLLVGDRDDLLRRGGFLWGVLRVLLLAVFGGGLRGLLALCGVRPEGAVLAGEEAGWG